MDKIQKMAETLGLNISGLTPDQARELVINEMTNIALDRVEAIGKASLVREPMAAAGNVHSLLAFLGALLCQAGEHGHEKLMFATAEDMEQLEIERSIGDAVTIVLDIVDDSDGEIH